MCWIGEEEKKSFFRIAVFIWNRHSCRLWYWTEHIANRVETSAKWIDFDIRTQNSLNVCVLHSTTIDCIIENLCDAFRCLHLHWYRWFNAHIYSQIRTNKLKHKSPVLQKISVQLFTFRTTVVQWTHLIQRFWQSQGLRPVYIYQPDLSKESTKKTGINNHSNWYSRLVCKEITVFFSHLHSRNPVSKVVFFLIAFKEKWHRYSLVIHTFCCVRKFSIAKKRNKWIQRNLSAW